MLSPSFAEHTARRYAERRPLLGEKDREVEAFLAPLSPDEALLVRSFVATLPLTDVFDATLETLLGFARHALMLREGPAAELPEDVFVHYVACPRINNEPLEDVRPALWAELAPRVAGLSAERAVIEINYWCAEMATYQTTDGRTLGARGVIAAAAGRCGEESTLLVTALRAVGIPARQLYTPWWAHCDDNHAWVEAYADGAWRYLGACEPEEALDRGWFTAASGRAPMVSTRLFSDYGCAAEDVLMRSGCAYVVNVTGSYADATQLAVRVVDAAGEPVPGAAVSLEVLNMAGWRSLVALSTDASGSCSVALGRMSVRVHASCGELMAEKDVDTAEVSEVTLAPAAAPAAGDWADLDVHAPEDHPARSQALSPEAAQRGRERKAAADELRRGRVSAMRAHAAELAARAAELRPGDDAAAVARMLELALGNADEVFAFLTAGPEPERLALLSSLAEKDYLDLTADVLEGHLSSALAARDPALDRETWERFVLCPRVHLEHLSPWRPQLTGMIDDELRQLVARDPAAAWQLLEGRLSFSPAEHVAKLVGTPAGALASGQASQITLRTLFVAVCRTLGVPARLGTADLRAEALRDGAWTCVEGATQAAPERAFPLRLLAPEGRVVTYGADVTVARLGSAMQTSGQELYGFHELDLWGCDPAALEVPAGTYRVTTTVRLPNGNQQASERVVVVDGPTELELRLRVPRADQMLQRIPLPAATGLAPRDGLSVLAFLKLAEEPTEHLENELADAAGALAERQVALTLVTRDGAAAEADPTLARCLGALREAGVDVTLATDDFSELPERLARRMFANPELLPLAVLLDCRGAGEPVGLFARGGYAVGTVELMMRLAALA